MTVARTSLVVALAFVVGCGKEAVKQPPSPPVDWASLQRSSTHAPSSSPSATPTDRERVAAKAYADAVATGDAHKLDVVLDDEAHFRLAGGKDVRGQSDVIRALMAVFGPFDQRRFAITRVLLTDSAQSLEWVMQGVHRETKKPVTFGGVTLIWTKDDGSISDIHLYVDEAMIEAQLGRGPESLKRVPAPAMPVTPTETHEQGGTDGEHGNAETVRDMLHALEENREADYLATFADDAEVTSAESLEPLRGKPALKNYFATMRAAIGYLAASIENAWPIGGYVVVEYQLVGEQRKPIDWVPVQKEPLVKLAIVDVIEMRDGRIRRVWRYDDPLQLAAKQP